MGAGTRVHGFWHLSPTAKGAVDVTEASPITWKAAVLQGMACVCSKELQDGHHLDKRFGLEEQDVALMTCCRVSVPPGCAPAPRHLASPDLPCSQCGFPVC